MSSVNLRNVSDEELIAEMKKRFVIVGGFHYKEWLTIDGIDKYSYEELNHYLDSEAHIDGDEFYQEHREALLEKFGDEREPDNEFLETKCGCEIIINSREHDECRCDGDGENWICADCYDGEYDESDDEETEVEKYNYDDNDVKVVWNKETEGWDCLEPYCRECGKPESDVEVDRFTIENEVFICKGCIKYDTNLFNSMEAFGEWFDENIKSLEECEAEGVDIECEMKKWCENNNHDYNDYDDTRRIGVYNKNVKRIWDIKIKK